MANIDVPIIEEFWQNWERKHQLWLFTRRGSALLKLPNSKVSSIFSSQRMNRKLSVDGNKNAIGKLNNIYHPHRNNSTIFTEKSLLQ